MINIALILVLYQQNKVSPFISYYLSNHYFTIFLTSILTFPLSIYLNTSIAIYSQLRFFNHLSLKLSVWPFIGEGQLNGRAGVIYHDFVGFSKVGLYKQPVITIDVNNLICIEMAKRLLNRMSQGYTFGNLAGTRPSAVSNHHIKAYYDKICKLSLKKNQDNLIPSVKFFKQEIHSDPIIERSLQGALDDLAKRGNKEIPLTGDTIDQMLQKLSVAATTPPVYQEQDITGVPFMLLFNGLFNSHFGHGFFSNPKVEHHLKEIFKDYALMLKSKKSLQALNQMDGWLSPQARAQCDYKDFEHNPSEPYYGYKSWNQWFTRKAVTGARPIDLDPKRIVNTCDSFRLQYPRQPVWKVHATEKLWLGGESHSLSEMFGAHKTGSQMSKIIEESFVGGTIYQGYLNPWCYHRWHAPYSGLIQKSFFIPGSFTLDKPTSPHHSTHSRSLLSTMSCRQVFIINTGNPLIGRIGVIQIGMAEIQSCKSIVKEGETVEKGQQMGQFEFGGASYALIFDKKARLKFNHSIYQHDSIHKDHPILQKANSWLAELLQ